MIWNHRIIFHTEDGPDHAYYAVHECFYGRKGAKIPHSWTAEPISPLEASMRDLYMSLTRMRAACRKPILRIAKGNRLVELK